MQEAPASLFDSKCHDLPALASKLKRRQEATHRQPGNFEFVLAPMPVKVSEEFQFADNNSQSKLWLQLLLIEGVASSRLSHAENPEAKCVLARY